MLKDLVLQNRSCRRYEQKEKVEMKVLKELVELARLSPSAKNLQPLKYILCNNEDMNQKIFPCLRWAGYLKEGGIEIEEGERPPAYIAILVDKTVHTSPGCDHGIAAQTILLGAVEKGLAGCMIGSLNEKKLREILKIPGNCDLLLVIAIGKSKEVHAIEDIGRDGNIRYWRDAKNVHHVPKRRLDEIIIKNFE